jgi:outer membrane protein
MRRCVRSSLTAAAVAVAVVVVVVRTPAHADVAHRPPGRRELTLPAAIEIALSGNPQLAMEAETIAAADARTRSDAALRLPLLGVKANALFWDRRIEADLGPDIGKVTIRDRFTGTVDFSVSQPLSGALAIGRLVERDRAIAAAARAEREGRRIEIAYQTAAAYLDALQARTLGQVARSTLIQLDGDLQHARVLLAGGTLQKVDVLRLEVEHARVEQQGLGAETSALAARRRLALLLGLPDGTELELAGVDTAPPALPWTEDEAVARAHSGRAEARAAASSSDAAELDIAVARASYYPAVSLVGIYSHAINTGLLGSADSAYAGVTLDWNLWDWGKRGADVDASRALSRKARLAQVALGEQIAVDTRARWQAARLARATLEVADRGRVAAVEAQRLQAARFAQGAATTIEVLDAETALANAEAQAVIGRYQYLVAWMALGREVGMLPAPPAAGDGRGAP